MKTKLSQSCHSCWRSRKVLNQYVCGGCNDEIGCPAFKRQQLKLKEELNNERDTFKQLKTN